MDCEAQVDWLAPLRGALRLNCLGFPRLKPWAMFCGRYAAIG